MNPSSPSTVVVLGTGGTIAGTADAAASAGYTAGRTAVESLVAGLGPGLEAEQVAQLDSKDMDAATWARLARRVSHHLARGEVAGVVVSHGTDTMEETAWLLARTLGAVAKPVVLTGAMRPADAADADGPRNLADAISAARSTVHGVVVAFAGSVYAARGVRKAHSARLDAFRGRPVEPGPEVLVPVDALPERLPWVEIVSSAAAVDGRAVDALVQAGVQGLVVATTGNGTLHAALEGALERATRRGIRVLRASRVAEGGIVEPNGGGARFPSSGDLAPPQARVELMLALLLRRP